MQHGWHAVVYLGHEAVGLAGDDARADHLFAVLVVPPLPDAGERQNRAVLGADVVGRLIPVWPSPLIEAAGWDNAAVLDVSALE